MIVQLIALSGCSALQQAKTEAKMPLKRAYHQAVLQSDTAMLAPKKVYLDAVGQEGADIQGFRRISNPVVKIYVQARYSGDDHRPISAYQTAFSLYPHSYFQAVSGDLEAPDARI